MSAWGKLHAATLELAKATPIKQRLALAFSKHLKHVDAAELPAALRCEFHDLMRGLEAVAPMPGETPVQATVRKMSAEDADLYAARIVVLFGEVARASAIRSVEAEAEEPRRERYAEDALNVVPLLYAAEA
ncbi:MAG TPA: hypothetical protein VMU00_01500 [Steroidobacteraceae bacterium]|nr:hypothetical protein [Steroidobacteraceae bacterium]